MRRIGERAPRFRVPVLMNGTLVYMDSARFQGRWVALCFLPYVGLVETAFLDHQAERFAQIDTALFIVNSGTRPLHRLWIGGTAKPRILLLTDPLDRLHRSFGIAATHRPARCQTVLIDREGILRFHLIHDFNDRGLDALQEVVTLSRTQNTAGPPVRSLTAATGQEALQTESHLISLQPSNTAG